MASFQAVNLLNQGMDVLKAAQLAVAPIAKAYPTYTGAVVVADAKGNVGRLPQLSAFSSSTSCACLAQGHRRGPE